MSDLPPYCCAECGKRCKGEELEQHMTDRGNIWICNACYYKLKKELTEELKQNDKSKGVPQG